MSDNLKLTREISELTWRSESELSRGEELRELLLSSVQDFGRKWDVHLPVFLSAPSFARLLWLDMVYRKALDLPGVLIEFGSQWGGSLNTFLLLKLIYEPWNIGRQITSFSTFSEGFVDVDAKDGRDVKVGDYSVSGNWKNHLTHILFEHASRSPINPGNNFSIIDGDVSITFKKWLDANPAALISHAHFDMDVYRPTKDALELCLSRMPKGAVLIFDELNCPSFPGETIAVQEVLGVHNIALRKSQFQPYSCYCIIE